MADNQPTSRKRSLTQRRRPTQQRAHARTRQILEVTAELLERVGVENLTTVLIARELNISVGSLYHYFPNKHAILHSLGRTWLDEMTRVLDEIEAMASKSLSLEDFVNETLDRLLLVYREQRALLPLAQALWSIPELRHLDAEHDDLIITKVSRILRLLGFTATDNELNRLGRAFLELTHSLLIVTSQQQPVRRERTLADMKSMVLLLFERHLADTASSTRRVEGP